MTTLASVKKAARAIGARVEDDRAGYTHECRVEAPRGMIWSCADIHELISAAYRPWKPDYQDLLDRMAYGVEKCDDPECDWCHDLPDP